MKKSVRVDTWWRKWRQIVKNFEFLTHKKCLSWINSDGFQWKDRSAVFIRNIKQTRMPGRVPGTENGQLKRNSYPLNNWTKKARLVTYETNWWFLFIYCRTDNLHSLIKHLLLWLFYGMSLVCFHLYMFVVLDDQFSSHRWNLMVNAN